MKKGKRYFRNRVEVLDIEPGFLWELKDGHFILVDDEQPIRVQEQGNEEKFYRIRRNDPARVLSFLLM